MPEHSALNVITQCSWGKLSVHSSAFANCQLALTASGASHTLWLIDNFS